LAVVVLHPFAVCGDHLFPGGCSCEFCVGHSSDDIEMGLSSS
jgi:hypothetical protein